MEASQIDKAYQVLTSLLQNCRITDAQGMALPGGAILEVDAAIRTLYAAAKQPAQDEEAS